MPEGTQPLVVEVVALDWKWLFFYPEQGIATVNELAAPVDRPIQFKITASSVMNSFYVPALAGQIYAMPGMETKLHAVINKPGEYEGFSANYSGAGFSGMRFKFHGLQGADFDQWVQKAKAEGKALGRDDYMQLERPSEREPVRRYASVAPGLYDAILNRCVEPGKMCMRQMMAVDATGGAGKAGLSPLALTEVPRGEQGCRCAPSPPRSAPPTTRPARRCPCARRSSKPPIPRSPTFQRGPGGAPPLVIRDQMPDHPDLTHLDLRTPHLGGLPLPRAHPGGDLRRRGRWAASR